MTGRIIKHILGIAERLFPLRKSPGMYVINYHGTPANLIPNFEKHLAYYKKHFQIIGPEAFETLADRNEYPNQPMLLLTFDDGMQNNHHVMHLLEKNGLKAYFFIVPAFVDAADPEQYLATVIRPGFSNPLEKAAEDFRPLDWETIRQAHQKGHGIGSHTYTHTLVKTDALGKSSHEILDSKEVIAKHVDVPVNAFCSINNTDVSVGNIQDQLIKENYKFHFTTYYGNNAPVDPYRIERINIEAYWHMNEVRYALGSIRKLLIKK